MLVLGISGRNLMMKMFELICIIIIDVKSYEWIINIKVNFFVCIFLE